MSSFNCDTCVECKWWENDARGIPLAKVCRLCRADKLSKFRPDVLTDFQQYITNKPIEED